MKRLIRIPGAILQSDERGDVLMEYVIVCGWIGVIVLLFLQEEFFNIDKGYVGRIGLEFLAANQRVLEGIALPIP